MALYKISKGKQVKIKRGDVKKTIMRANNWTEQQYNKERWKLKNRLRAYELYQAQHGVKVQQQSPVELLYKQAKAKIREGSDYKQSLELERIKAFPSYGNVKQAQKYLHKASTQLKVEEIYTEITYDRFRGLLLSNPQARYIADSITDPVLREKALTDFANKLHLKMDEQHRAIQNEAIPFGETFGSDEGIDFDIDDYL